MLFLIPFCGLHSKCKDIKGTVIERKRQLHEQFVKINTWKQRMNIIVQVSINYNTRKNINKCLFSKTQK